MSIDVPLIGRATVELDVSGFLRDGSALTGLTAVDVGVGPAGGDSTSVTTWYTVTVTNMTATFQFLGAYVPITTGPGVLVPLPPRGVDLWQRLTDTPDIAAVRVDHVRPV